MNLLFAFLASLLLPFAAGVGAASVEFLILDDTGQRSPGRIHLLGPDGKPHLPRGNPSWADHFVCDGSAKLELAPGAYRYSVERGPEFTAAAGEITVTADRPDSVTARLRRSASLEEEGWFSGETHVHRPLADVELLMRAENLHVAQVITWWNRTNPWKQNSPPVPALRNFDRNRYYHSISGEDERDGGALLYCDLNRPLEITAGRQHYPSSLVYARAARTFGAKWLDAEKPFWWDFPIWLAHGVADTVGIAHNHMHRGGVLGNEAWGRTRDLELYPGVHGNALWTQQIYYHALNCGLRLPPSAGSASGVLPNPVGYNRVYVHVDGEFTYEKWREGLLAGRSFVSNGPLLRCRANNRLPGEVFRSAEPITITLDVRLDSRDPIKALELVRNGAVEKITPPARFTIDSSGWFLVRSVTDLTNTFRFASTAPWYVEIAGKPMKVAPESPQFFLDWCEQRIAALAKRPELSQEQVQELIEPWREASNFFRTKLPSR